MDEKLKDQDLDLYDIQGNIVKAYGRYGYPVARYFFFRVIKSAGARQFVSEVAPFITTAAQVDYPQVTTNIGFTYEGLKRLQVPDATLHGFPEDFSMGMKARRDITGDRGPNYFKNWDPIWYGKEKETDEKPNFGTIYDQHTHIFMSINGRLETEGTPETFPARWAKMLENMEKHFEKILSIANEAQVDGIPGVRLLRGHRGDHGDDRYQLGKALRDGKEHFGYTDGISSTYFKGSGDDASRVIGGGKPNGGDPATKEGWDPIETGEFLLGHKDEAYEYPRAPGPPLFARNGTFLVYRKLHQNVESFNQLLDKVGEQYENQYENKVTKEEFAAKLAGRWRNGAPLVTFPTEEAANAFDDELQALRKKSRGGESLSSQERARYEELKLKLRAFDYLDDPYGAKCPFSSHMRRANPRSSLTFGDKEAFGKGNSGALSNRRRVLRRGLPYGDSEKNKSDDGDHGVIIMILNASISRQFEFVQQQWFNFGNDFKQANDQDPILGNHGVNKDGQGNGRMVIEGDKKTGKPPFFCDNMPTLVEVRGGDYYFIPSMTSLRLIGSGTVDST